jgi:thioredoxin-like negative regulator of GroEL
LIEYGALVRNDAANGSRAARIGRLSLRLNEPDRAVTWLQRAAATSPADVQVLASLADAQLRTGDRNAALATVTTALERDPTNSVLLALSRRAQ